MPNLIFTHATLNELEEVVSIYNSTVASRTVTADTEPVSVESRLPWFHQHNPHKRPLWLVRDEDSHTVGWASFQDFYGRAAYEATAEISIYLHPRQRGKGLGKEILQHCISTCPQLSITTLLGYIFEHNAPSLKLFYSLGFTDWGTLPNIARLDGIERTLKIVGRRTD